MKYFKYFIRHEEVYETLFYVKAETREKAKELLTEKFYSSKQRKRLCREIRMHTKYDDSIQSGDEGNYMGPKIKKNAFIYLGEIESKNNNS